MNFLLRPAVVGNEIPPTGLDYEVWGNSLYAWLVVIMVAALAVPAILIVRRAVIGSLRRLSVRTPSRIDNIVLDVIESLRVWWFVAIVLYIAGQWLTMPDRAAWTLKLIFVVATSVQVVLTSRLLIEVGINASVARRSTIDGESDAALRSASGIIRAIAVMVVSVLVFLLALQNMGVEVTPLIAGLGIGGIAVALAAQSVLADPFGSLTILLDKPFLVGDFIVVGDRLGTVEHIGIKTTRLRALSGEQLVFSNSDLLSSRIQNFKRMQERRIVFAIGVAYETPMALVREIPGIIRQIVEAQTRVRLDRVHFKAFGAYSLDFEAVYFVTAPDYNVYMDIQQAINLGLFERFKKAGINFAYPTQVEILRPEPIEGADTPNRADRSAHGKALAARHGASPQSAALADKDDVDDGQ